MLPKRNWDASWSTVLLCLLIVFYFLQDSKCWFFAEHTQLLICRYCFPVAKLLFPNADGGSSLLFTSKRRSWTSLRCSMPGATCNLHACLSCLVSASNCAESICTLSLTSSFRMNKEYHVAALQQLFRKSSNLLSCRSETLGSSPVFRRLLPSKR